MLKEVQDEFDLYQAVHASIDKMLDGLSDEEWVQRAGSEFNSIASVIEHVVLVEEKFLSGLAGTVKDISTQRPFQDGASDVSAVRNQWQQSVSSARAVLETLTEDALNETGMELGVGKLNKRQLLSYMIAHTAHHRGQIPIIKKLNRQVPTE